MKNPISAYCDWRNDQMGKAAREPTLTRAALHGLGVGTVDGLLSIGVMAAGIVLIGGIAKIVKKIKE